MKRLIWLFFLAALACVAQEPEGAEASNPYAIWKWINFLILAGGLGYLMAKNLPAYFRSRTASIQKGITEARQMKMDAERRAADVDRRMNALGSEIEKLRVQSHTEMEQEGERIRQQTAVEIRKLEAQAQVEIESAGKTAQRELRAYAADLALDLAEQRVRARLDGNTDAALVDSFVSDLKRRERNS